MKTIHITVNSRLTATLKSQAISPLNSASENVDIAHKSGAYRGISVVETPDIMTLNQWWEAWQSRCLLRGELSLETLPKKVLNSFEAQWLWEQVLEAELTKRTESSEQIHTEPDGLVNASDEVIQSLALLNVSSTAKQLYQAWLLSKEWFPEDWLETEYLSQESWLYKNCQARYLAKLDEHHWQDEALVQQQHLAWLAEGKGKRPQRFVLHGFDELTPHVKAWRSAIEALGGEVSIEAVTEASEQIEHQFFRAQDAQDEVQQVALWAEAQWQKLSKIKAPHGIKIGIISPNLADYKVALTQSLDEQLSLAQHQPLNSLRSAPPFYNLSLGTALTELPLVKNAWLTLSLFLQPNKPCRYTDWSEWLSSPYTQDSFVLRQQADAAFRRLQWSKFTWPKLIATDAASALPKRLKARLDKRAALTEVESTPNSSSNRCSLSQFIETVWTVLEDLGWPGNRNLNSDEHQQKTIFESAVTQFSKVTEVGGKQTISAWLALFRRFLSEQLHQSQSKGLQPIQVMGMLEAGGQTFDALWVLGLTDEAWPRMPNPNPFLPMDEQRSQRSPRCDAKRELDYAQQVTERLKGCSPSIVWSYAQHQGDAELLVSPLVEQLQASLAQATELSQYSPQPYHSLADRVFALRSSSEPLSWLLDARGPQVPAGSKAPGGSGILQAQSQCPLMAFMDFRLGAKYGLQSVEESLQDNNQGILVHKVLELFWEETKTQSALLTLSDDALSERLIKHIKTSFEALLGTVENAYLALEQSRILALCLDWLALEKTRVSFVVVERELECKVPLAGIEFSIVIDRVDEVAGEQVVIDYKTGKASINKLLATPTKAPQLAVYLHALGEQVSGIGYGLLHSDEGVKMSAITADEDVLMKARSVQVFAKMAEKEGHEYYETTWPHFLGHLKQQVLDLAGDIQLGSAPMAFDSEVDIQYANCKLALRLPEVKRQHQAFLDESRQKIAQEKQAEEDRLNERGSSEFDPMSDASLNADFKPDLEDGFELSFSDDASTEVKQ
ncbi:MAG: hypothetical protein GXO35_08540 [Gammaproteobacteria bacterium]|nr:hypothetical protein [Gammaproteobacteria bacterium]